MPKLKVLIKPYPNNYTIHNNIIYINGHSFSFDTILQTRNLESVYEKIKESTLNFLEGKNSTIFAYGQTGSGKSYTMGLSGKSGVIQFALKDLFEKIRLEKEKICLGVENFDMIFKISMLEIYNEELFDLLNNKQHLSLKFNNNLVISGLKEVEVKSYEESVNLINLGLKIRATKKTAMNNTSSRSHGIIFVSLYKVNELISKFSFVDLAGSERIKKSKVSGLERKEAISINSSLLSLCNCINLLSQKAQHIPYRQSKLTRILQDALEGECFTAMIVCINGNNFESYDALNYATRAMNIQSVSVKKQNVKIDFTNLIKENGDLKCLVDQLKKENDKLKKENEKLKMTLFNENKPIKIENNLIKEKDNISTKKCKIKIENNKLHKLKENEKEILFHKLTNITVNDLLNTPIKRLKENKKVTFSDQNEYKYFKPIKEKINFLEKINNKIKNEEEENYKS